MDKEEQIHAELSAIDQNGLCLCKLSGVFADNTKDVAALSDKLASKYPNAVRVVIDMALPEAYEARREQEKVEKEAEFDLLALQCLRMARKISSECSIRPEEGIYKANVSIMGNNVCIDTNSLMEFFSFITICDTIKSQISPRTPKLFGEN